jgi:serine/threonine protein kinase
MVQCGTPAYCAPEIFQKTKHLTYTHKVDIYSIGCIIYYILTGTHYFLALNTYHRSKQPIFEIYDLSANTINFLKLLLHRDPDVRPNPQEALGNGWFKADFEAVKSSLEINRQILLLNNKFQSNSR